MLLSIKAKENTAARLLKTQSHRFQWDAQVSVVWLVGPSQHSSHHVSHKGISTETFYLFTSKIAILNKFPPGFTFSIYSIFIISYQSLNILGSFR